MVEMIDVGKDANYNDIINGYIHKLLESKHGKQMAESQINASNIKVVSLPLKNEHGPGGNSIEASELKKKNFKILQEFRISIDNVNKKFKVIPVTSSKKSNEPSSDNNRPNMRSSPRGNYAHSSKPKFRREEHNYRSNNRKSILNEPRHNPSNNAKGTNVHNVNKRLGLMTSRRVHSFRRRFDNNNRNIFSRRNLMVDPIYSRFMNRKFANMPQPSESRNSFNRVVRPSPFNRIR